ncbi:hypothetical protein O181_068095 [Austropuccinia psidii MF-1]|uniref:Integrase zinc-binding domain-containing protein n=1 Tax=Austropuccinia psidii MF-1 TaxID=1389203 RepID=A0A9Q3F0C6_9BASI|nr:hypothetical protein [Austropuccinia psidii MF-1]
MSFLGLDSYYRQHLKDFAMHARSLYRIGGQKTDFEMTQGRIQAYEKIRYALIKASLLLMPDWKLPFKLWALPNKPENTAYATTAAEPQIPIEGIKITDVGTEFFQEVRDSYKLDNNCCIPTSLLDKDCKDAALGNSLDDIWKTSSDNGIFHLFDGILYNRSKQTCVMVLCSRMLINTILLECHDNSYSGHLSEDRKMEIIETCAWWPSWRKDLIEYCHICDRCQKANKATGKRFGLMIHIQGPSTPWEVFHMDWVTALPPGGDKSYNACLVIVDRYSKTKIFLPCHKDDTAMDTAFSIRNKVIFHTGLFKNIISDRDPNSHQLYGLI